MDLYISDVEVDPALNFLLPLQSSPVVMFFQYISGHTFLYWNCKCCSKRALGVPLGFTLHTKSRWQLKGMIVIRWWDRRVANNVKRFQKSALEGPAYTGRRGFEKEFINNRPTLYQQWFVRNCYLERSTDKKAQQGANRSRGGVARKARSNYIWSRRQINQGDTDIRCAWR